MPATVALRKALLAAAEQNAAGAHSASIAAQAMQQIATEFSLSLRDIAIAALSQSIWPLCYMRNSTTLSAQQQITLLEARVFLVGLGGLGGQVFDQLLRLGIGHITAADGDFFEESNLNRQLLANAATMGRSKAEAAQQYAQTVHPVGQFFAIPMMLDKATFKEQLIATKATVVVDALGGLGFRQAVQETAAACSLALVTGAVAGWSGIVATVLPGMTGPADSLAAERDDSKPTVEDSIGTMAPTVAFAAALMAHKVVQLLTGSHAGETQIFDLSCALLETVSLNPASR